MLNILIQKGSVLTVIYVNLGKEKSKRKEILNITDGFDYIDVGVKMSEWLSSIALVTIISLIVILICAIYYTNQRDNYYLESRRAFNESVMNNARENN